TNASRCGMRGLTEREDIGLDAGLGEHDLEGAVFDRPGLAEQLGEALGRYGAAAVLVDVEPVRAAGRLSVDEHPERNGRAAFTRPEDEVNVAAGEPEPRPP